jgi:aspartate carbamoyltransferase regulatory subunit
MTYYDLLKQYISTGYPLNKRQFDKINKDGQLLNSYFYSRDKLIYIDKYDLKKYEVDFIENNPKYFSKFKPYNLIRFLEYSKNPDVIANRIINTIGYTLNNLDIYYILKYSIKKDFFIEKILNLKNYELNDNNIYPLIEYSSNRYLTAKDIIKLKGNKLNINDIYAILYLFTNFLFSFSDADKLSALIIKEKGNDLNLNEMIFLIESSQNPDNIAKLIINEPSIGLSYYEIYAILEKTKNTDEIAELIINQFSPFTILTLDPYIINALIVFSKNKEHIKNLLIQAGVDREKIPE